MGQWTAIINNLPPDVVGAVAFLIVVEISAITGATALNKLGAADHPLYKIILWLIAFPPVGIVYVMTNYYLALMLREWWAWLSARF